jgi:hypothetical protein
MQDSFSELIKLLLPKIIVEYFELASRKEEEELHLYLKKSIDSEPNDCTVFTFISKLQAKKNCNINTKTF